MTTCETYQELGTQPAPRALALATASVLRRLYPRNRAKLLARDLGCPVRSAENHLAAVSMPAPVLARLAVKHGWPFILAVFEPLLGPVPVADIERMERQLADETRTYNAARADLVATAPRGLGWLVPPAVAPVAGRAARKVARRAAGGRR